MIFFIRWPSSGRHLLTPSMVHISVINTHITNYNLSIKWGYNRSHHLSPSPEIITGEKTGESIRNVLMAINLLEIF